VSRSSVTVEPAFLLLSLPELRLPDESCRRA